jgi:hypothetical protein
MTQVERLAAWIGQVTYADFAEEVRRALMIHILAQPAWEQAQAKFERLTTSYAEHTRRQELMEILLHLESSEICERIDLLASVKTRSIQ